MAGGKDGQAGKRLEEKGIDSLNDSYWSELRAVAAANRAAITPAYLKIIRIDRRLQGTGDEARMASEWYSSVRFVKNSPDVPPPLPSLTSFAQAYLDGPEGSRCCLAGTAGCTWSSRMTLRDMMPDLLLANFMAAGRLPALIDRLMVDRYHQMAAVSLGPIAHRLAQDYGIQFSDSRLLNIVDKEGVSTINKMIQTGRYLPAFSRTDALLFGSLRFPALIEVFRSCRDKPAVLSRYVDVILASPEKLEAPLPSGANGTDGPEPVKWDAIARTIRSIAGWQADPASITDELAYETLRLMEGLKTRGKKVFIPSDRREGRFFRISPAELAVSVNPSVFLSRKGRLGGQMRKTYIRIFSDPPDGTTALRQIATSPRLAEAFRLENIDIEAEMASSRNERGMNSENHPSLPEDEIWL